MIKTVGRSSDGSAAILWLVLMFLFASNFLSAGGYFLLVLMAAYFVIHLREFSFRITEIFLFVFGVEYFLFYIIWYKSATFREVCNYFVAPWLLYWLGRNMAYRSKNDDLPLQMTNTLTLGFFAYGFLCIIYSMSFAPPTAGARVMYKFWDRTDLSVTAGGLLFSMAIGVAFGQLTSKNSKWTRLFWLAVLGVCIYHSFTWAHRTSIYMIIILVLFNYLAALLASKVSSVKKIVLLAGSLLLISVTVLCLMFDIGGCYSWLQGQWLYQRLTNPLATNSADRFLIWRSFFEQWLLYPFGGKQFPISASFVHNLWLDVYYLCGILPFISLVIVTVIIVKNFFVYRKIKSAQNDQRSVHILSNCYIAVFLAFMVEPVMSAYPYVFLAVILVSGCIEGAIMKAQQQDIPT